MWRGSWALAKAREGDVLPLPLPLPLPLALPLALARSAGVLILCVGDGQECKQMARARRGGGRKWKGMYVAVCGGDKVCDCLRSTTPNAGRRGEGADQGFKNGGAVQ